MLEYFIYWTRHENESAVYWLGHPSGRQLSCPINIPWFTGCVSHRPPDQWKFESEDEWGSPQNAATCAIAQVFKASQHCAICSLGLAVHGTGTAQLYGSNSTILVDISPCTELPTSLAPGTRSISVSVITASPLVDHPLVRRQVGFQYTLLQGGFSDLY